MSPSLAHMHCFLFLRGKMLKKSKFRIEKCLQRVLNSCELVFRQHYHCKNNRLTTGRPRDTARRNHQPIWHSSAKHVKEYSKIKKLGCYCFCKTWFRPICPFHRLPLGGVPVLSNDSFVCNVTCLDIARILCLVLLFSGWMRYSLDPTGSPDNQNNVGT